MPPSLHIRVSLADQALHLCLGDELLRRYTVSTSSRGPGSQQDSFKTPLGSFRICEKIGDGEPHHTIFSARLPVGLWDPASPSDEDLILTRILRLEGLDPDNLNTYDRYIYIHGTNHLNHLGATASHGCIRMSCNDVLDLYDRTPTGTPLTITELPL